MAYNNLSGTVFLPDLLTTRLNPVSGSIISGNLDYSDGANIINVPRVNNATNNALITNVDGDANQLFCESNLTFDNSILTVVGNVSASVNISASYFYGDGSKLSGITAGGGGGGIFTTVNSSHAYTTSSITVGAGSTPAHPLSVSGISQLSGGVLHKRVKKSANYSVTTADYVIGVDTSGNTVTLTFPAAAAALDGQTWVVKDEGGNAYSNNIIITGSSDTNTIDGQKHIVLESNNASVQIYCDGAHKYFIF